MSDEIGMRLWKTLNDVDRIRKRQTIAFAVLFCIVEACLLWLGRLGAIANTDLRQMLLSAVITVLVGVAYVAMALALFVTKMLRKVLKAIEPLSVH